MRRRNDVTSWEIFDEVGEFLITNEGIFSVRCEGRFKEYDVIRW